MLSLDRVAAGYGQSQVLFDVNLEIGDGEVVTLLGRNGMGKTTTVRAIAGLNPASAGRITLADEEITKAAPHRIARLGLGLVPEGRRIFPTLTAHENLVATAANRHRAQSPWTLARVHELLPALRDVADRPGHALSGGEQQMVAIGRALLTNPQVLVLDEAAEGLAPMVRRAIWDCLRALKETGQSILVIDQNLEALLELGDRHYIMEKGRVVWQGDSDALAAEPALLQRHLGVAS